MLFQKKIRVFSKVFSHAFHFITSEGKEFFVFLREYLTTKSVFFSSIFERNKNVIVKSILLKRGRLNRMFLHISAMVVLIIGITLSPFISEANPFTQSSIVTFAEDASAGADPLFSEDVFQTMSDSNIRNEAISYTVQKGDTLSTIAKKFEISEDTIKWTNNLKSDSITVGDELRILPVTGVQHKVVRGDTVYTIAKKYATNPQAIVDYPFNDFANPQTFSLVEGQILTVPDGIIPEEKPKFIPRRQYIATGPVSVSGSGFAWPAQGVISQFYAWYHKGIDIAAPVGTPIVAGNSGRVEQVYTNGWHGGYGTHVIISGDNGYTTLYAHMSGVNVSAGDSVTAGKSVIGWIGLTGRTTGAHVHYEVRGNGFSDPLAFLR